jgi:hypothetical protein
MSEFGRTPRMNGHFWPRSLARSLVTRHGRLRSQTRHCRRGHQRRRNVGHYGTMGHRPHVPHVVQCPPELIHSTPNTITMASPSQLRTEDWWPGAGGAGVGKTKASASPASVTPQFPFPDKIRFSRASFAALMANFERPCQNSAGPYGHQKRNNDHERTCGTAIPLLRRRRLRRP